MKNDRKNVRPGTITVIAIAILLIVILIANGSKVSEHIENGLATVLTPIESIAAKTSKSISNFFKKVFRTTDADIENERLRAELAAREQQDTELNELRKENERLSALLNYASSRSLTNEELCTGKVIATSNGIWFRTITLDIGRSDGVDIDMAVIANEGLVGRVSEVGYNWCKVTCIIDASSTVPIMVERTRDNCMAMGVLDGSTTEAELQLYYLPSDRTNLTPGDTVITSGIGGIYPKGIMVGTITEVFAEGEIHAIISPSVDFMHLEEVAVILTGGNSK